MKYFWHSRWLIPFILVGYILWQAVVASGSLQAVTDFRERTQYFDVLLPAGRVDRTDQGIVLKQEPVYIDIRLPVRTHGVSLELMVAADSVPIKLGWQSASDFSLVFSQSEPVKNGDLVLYHYDLSDVSYVRPGHKIRFIISAPGLIPGSVRIKGASVTLKRGPASLDWFNKQFSKIIWN